MHTIESLKNDLDKLGIKGGDTLLVHSAMRTIGDVERRADGVLDALSEYLIPAGGMLVFPTLTYDRRAGADNVFSVSETASLTGLLSNLFLRRPGTIRSWHPTHSVAAAGAGAEEYVAGHHLFITPCARTSPWGRLIDRRAGILFLGTGIRCNTFLHGVEEQSGIPGVLSDEPELLYTITPAGEKLAVPSRRHIGHHNRFFGKVEALLEERGVLRRGRFGDSVCEWMDARGVAEVITPLLIADHNYFLHD